MLGSVPAAGDGTALAHSARLIGHAPGRQAPRARGAPRRRLAPDARRARPGPSRGRGNVARADRLRRGADGLRGIKLRDYSQRHTAATAGTSSTRPGTSSTQPELVGDIRHRAGSGSARTARRCTPPDARPGGDDLDRRRHRSPRCPRAVDRGDHLGAMVGLPPSRALGPEGRSRIDKRLRPYLAPSRSRPYLGPYFSVAP
jgi:hypothetical protein